MDGAAGGCGAAGVAPVAPASVRAFTVVGSGAWPARAVPLSAPMLAIMGDPLPSVVPRDSAGGEAGTTATMGTPALTVLTVLVRLCVALLLTAIDPPPGMVTRVSAGCGTGATAAMGTTSAAVATAAGDDPERGVATGCRTPAVMVRRVFGFSGREGGTAFAGADGAAAGPRSTVRTSGSGSGLTGTLAGAAKAAGAALGGALDMARAGGTVATAGPAPVDSRVDDVAASLSDATIASCGWASRASELASSTGAALVPVGAAAAALASVTGAGPAKSVVALATASATDSSTGRYSADVGSFPCFTGSAPPFAAGRPAGGAAAPAIACAHSAGDVVAMRWTMAAPCPATAVVPCVRSGSIRSALPSC
jgi:hypothetical protein